MARAALNFHHSKGHKLRVNGEVVGAVGIAGLSKETDTEIARTAAAAVSPSPKTLPRD
jgi:glc operon protein GlcG